MLIVTLYRPTFEAIETPLPDCCPGCWEFITEAHVVEAPLAPVSYRDVTPDQFGGDYPAPAEVHAGDWGEEYLFAIHCQNCGHLLASIDGKDD